MQSMHVTAAAGPSKPTVKAEGFWQGFSMSNVVTAMLLLWDWWSAAHAWWEQAHPACLLSSSCC
jgi:hypothetical protein